MGVCQNVAPFFLKVKRSITTLHDFLWEYGRTFYRQYIAYMLKDPALYTDPIISLPELMTIKTADERVHYIQKKGIATFLRRYEEKGWQDARVHWEDMIRIPEFLAANTGVHVAVIIDEFQDLKTCIYDTDDKTRIDPGRDFPVDLCSTFDRQALSKKAPMLVSGSAVTMIFRTVMGGALGGRFGFKYLKPMAIEDGALLAEKLLPGVSHELALYLSYQLGGHPYYITCCAKSDFSGKDFSTRENIDRVIDYEVTRGKIYGFWHTHFSINRELINQDDDTELGRKIIYYFTKYNSRPVEIGEIASKLNVSKEKVQAKIEKLHQADLVYDSNFRYYAFNDYMLMRYIQYSFGAELENVDAIDVKAKGFDNYLKGKLLEMLIQNLFHSFGGEELPGELFGREEPVVVPKFQQVGSVKVKLPTSGEYEIDAYGEYGKGTEKIIWVAECKYRERPVNTDEVEKVIRAVEVVKKEKAADKAVVWLVSAGGFTAEAKILLHQRGCFYSTEPEINALAKSYGISVTLK